MKNQPIEEVPAYKSFIAVFSGSSSDLGKLNFSALGLKFLNLKSEEFHQIFLEVESKQLSIKRVVEEYLQKNANSDNMFALLPQDFSESVPEKHFWMVRNLLLVIFPSSLTLHYLIDIQQIEGNKLYTYSQSHFQFNLTWDEDFYDNYLLFHDHELDNINSFIPIYIERIEKLSYLEATLHSYLSSFFQPFPEMEFLNLCIALETIVDGRTELTYRIKRNTAILLGVSASSSKRIYSNVDKVYSLRSKIVHTGKFDYGKVREYTPYVRNLVSRLITELLTHNINQLQDLNMKLTEIGFGGRKELSENYISYELSNKVWLDCIYTTLD